MTSIVLDLDPLSPADVAAIARRRTRLEIGPSAQQRLERSRAVIDAHATGARPVYGLNTGLGASVDTALLAEEMIAFQERVPHSHSAGMGPLLSTEAVRAMTAARVSSMCMGGSGVSPAVVHKLVEALNAGFHPLVPAWGSIGAADLSPLAHLARALVGSGWVEHGGAVMPAVEALSAAGIVPMSIAMKDGHAIVVANSLSVGTASLALQDISRVLDWSLSAIALNFEGFRANVSAIDDLGLAARPAFGQRATGAVLRSILAGSGLWTDGAARRLQDPLSYRCAPQVSGALAHALSEATEITSMELASSGDNPVILADDGRVVSQGNFDMTAFALSWERLGQAIAHAAVGSANRSMRLMSPVTSDLPRFLSSQGQSQAGYALLQKSIASLEAEIRHLANPISLHPMAVADGVEDQASMAPRVVHKASEMVDRFRYLVAIELIVAATAIEMRGVEHTVGEGVHGVLQTIRSLVPPLMADRELTSDMYAVTRHLSRKRPPRTHGRRVAASAAGGQAP